MHSKSKSPTKTLNRPFAGLTSDKPTTKAPDNVITDCAFRLTSEPRFTTHIKVFTSTDPLELFNTIPRTKAEIEEQIEEAKKLGLVFRSSDGLTVTTYMPKTILKIVARLTPVEDKAVEN